MTAICLISTPLSLVGASPLAYHLQPPIDRVANHAMHVLSSDYIRKRLFCQAGVPRPFKRQPCVAAAILARTSVATAATELRSYMKRSNRSFPALQTGQTNGGCGRAHKYPQTLQRHTGNGRPFAVTCSISSPCAGIPPTGRRSGMATRAFLPLLMSSETYRPQ